VNNSHHHQEATGLKDRVIQETGVNITECYQCGKCTAGCPLNEDMDIMPNQILRMLQLELPGYEDKILSSMSIWLCLACDQCYSRCPQEVLISKAMDFLRQESIRQNKVNPKAKDILKFHESFLNSVEKHGKLHELGLTISYKLRSMNLMQDISVAPAMLSKGKLHMFPHNVKNSKAIEKIFDKTKKNKGGEQ
jgi:heterodisulfide reductase subunit C2